MIDNFMGEYRFLSNFHPAKITYDGIEYPSTEHAYQAHKTLDLKERIKISKLPSCGQARRYGNTITLRPDWDEVKYKIMEDVTKLKYQDLELRAKLLNTKDEELIEGNHWGDVYWGVCNGVGQNNLGKILMNLRTELNPHKLAI